MDQILSLAATNLLSPIILSFALGVAASLARSDLNIPEAVAKGMSIYLLFAIGFKGGVSVADHGIDATLAASLVAGIVLSAVLPLIAFALLQVMGNLSRLDAAAVAAHYGSISIVTFVAATSVLDSSGIASEGYMVAVAAAMEAPAILSALWLISRGGDSRRMDPDLMREIMLNGSIVLLVGSFAIGWITGGRRAGQDRGVHRVAVSGCAVPVPAGYGAGCGPGPAWRVGCAETRRAGVWDGDAGCRGPRWGWPRACCWG